jgi:glycosyltransferase involved in cell wall biosynthesis
MTITQVGPFPPPYGGVSMHIQRLRQRLQQVGCEVPVWCDPSSKTLGPGIYRLPSRRRPACYVGWLLDGWRQLPGEITHFHELRTYSFWIWCTVQRGQRVLITVHNQFMLEQQNFFAYLSRWAVRRSGSHPNCRFIAVSSQIRSQLNKLGVSSTKISVIPAYLPPEDPPHVENLSPRIREFGALHRPLLSVYGFRCAKDPVWGDLYGFDLSLQALSVVRQRHPQAGLVALTPGRHSQPYFQELRQQARQFGLAEHVLWETDSMPDARSLWKFSDVYLRPTATDGDAVAVREAMSVGTPVVASDVCDRPKGCIVYPAKNLAAFAAAIETALNSGHFSGSSDCERGFENIMDVYGELWPMLKGHKGPPGKSGQPCADNPLAEKGGSGRGL